MKFRRVLAGALTAVVAAGSLSISAFSYDYTGKTVTYGDFTFEEQNDGTLTVTKYNGDDLHVVIPDKVNGKTVTIIGSYAFGDFADIVDNPYSMTSIEIPDAITTIQGLAFLATPSLESVNIPASVDSIAYSSLASIDALQAITVDKNNKKYADIDGVLFNKDITELITYPSGKTETNYDIPEGVTTIGNSAFVSDYLISVSIPASMKEIDPFAFYGLQELNVDENNKNFASIDGVLFNKEKTKIVKYPYGRTETSYTIPDGVTIIGERSFLACSLTSIEIPDGVTAIEDSAFVGCKLTSIDLPDTLISIGDSAFLGCDFESIEIPDGVTQIGAYAFQSCSSLTSVTIPASVTTFGRYVDSDWFVDSIFEYGSDDLTIYGYTNSAAETYAKEHEINFVALGEVNNPTTTTEAPAATTTEAPAAATTTESSAVTTTPSASDNGEDGNKPTGVVIAIIPAIAAAAGVIISKKRK